MSRSISRNSLEESTPSSRDNGEHVLEIELPEKSRAPKRRRNGKKKSDAAQEDASNDVIRTYDEKDASTHVEDAVALNLTASRLALAKLPVR